MIIGTGIDLIEISRVQEALTQRGKERFLHRLFTPYEQTYCFSRHLPAQHLAARFVAKEAVMKALGTGWSRGIKWTEIEVRSTHSGVPTLSLSGAALHTMQERSIERWHLSLTHSDQYAVALAIAEGSISCERPGKEYVKATAR